MRCVRCLLLLVLFLPVKTWATPYFEQLGWMTPDSKLNELIQYPYLLENIYQRNGEQLIWFDLQQSSKLEFQLEILDRAGFSPLFARQLTYLRYYRENNRWYEYDLLATDTLLSYLSYAENAPKMGQDWYFDKRLTEKLPLPTAKTIEFVFTAIDQQHLSALIEMYTPDSPEYDQLVNTYLHLTKYLNSNIPLYHQKGTRRAGDRLTDRAALIQRLEMLDIDVSRVTPGLNWYDSSLTGAVMQFQRIHGLTPDGAIGPATLRWINMTPEQRLDMLAINAERVRMWPAQRDALIVVNVPSYDLKYWYLGKEQFESKVVVGRASRKTPVMSIKLDSLIFNPTWNVPWTIMVEDILPKVKRDVKYLANHNLEIIPSWGAQQTIDPETIDWAAMNPKAFPYKLRQRSGNSNSLGLYKFNTPNRRAIYLHDTPGKYLFDKQKRAFSSGCIRVEHADQFASVLLQNQGLTDAGDQVRLSGLSNRAVALKEHIPVHIIYQTAWYESGVVHYRDDIYRFDGTKYGKS
ncbi:Murein L,D-transpeptidase YcbB/YkuD [Vibrio xiamenensis]|uniref:Murein L,D-transpeptidase YcbB/YkuD n=1 Tax=Vibrio xiamenensis TaxID=861298 RepID=A0A1G7ZQR9_9VIBR|nr:L,D-transpeptidase family protein [Vibrio xiamenensis]SDH10886.1 Murein L,D-transpeptidase YcbB/YkuD [Vibrio xiamenensis]